MLAPLTGTLLVTQLFGAHPATEAYSVVHDGVRYQCLAHPAWDLNCVVSTPVSAVEPGVVHFFGSPWGFPDDGYGPLGLHAVLTMANGEAFWYAHLSVPAVDDGAHVFGGALIARSGATGNVTGPHLHLAWRPAHVNLHNGFDGFDPWQTHLDTSVHPLIDLHLV